MALFKKVLIGCALFLLSALIPGIVFGGASFIYSIVDRSKPEVVFIGKPPLGVGLQPISIKLEISDGLAGLSEVIVRSIEGYNSRALFTKDYKNASDRTEDGVIGDSDSVFEDSIEFQIPSGKDSGYPEGDISLVITAVDNSIYRNLTTTTVVLKVDYETPRIVPLNESITGHAGGTVLVFYQVRDRNLGFHGVRLGSGLYPGFSAEKLDKAFADFKDVYFALFPVLTQCNDGGCAPELLAVDQVGNQSAVYFEFNKKSINTSSRIVELNGPELEYRVAELYQQYLRRAKISNDDPSFSIGAQNERNTFRFKRVIGEYQSIIAEDMELLFKSPKGVRYWQGAFAGLGAGVLKSRFGDTLQFKIDGLDAGSITSSGITWADSKGSEVRASNGGIVIYVGLLGAYGNAVIIDHGFGLVSLYGYLDSVLCKEGDRINKTSVIAKVGNSGIAGQPSVYFELRVHGVPVDPSPWWDEGWIKNNIEKPLMSAKRKIGVSSIGGDS